LALLLSHRCWFKVFCITQLFTKQINWKSTFPAWTTKNEIELFVYLPKRLEVLGETHAPRKRRRRWKSEWGNFRSMPQSLLDVSHCSAGRNEVPHDMGALWRSVYPTGVAKPSVCFYRLIFMGPPAPPKTFLVFVFLAGLLNTCSSSCVFTSPFRRFGLPHIIIIITRH